MYIPTDGRTIGKYNAFSPIYWMGRNITTTATILRPLYRSTCISWHLQLRTGGFCWCKVLCLHALGNGNQRIWIRDKTLEFFSTVLSTLSPYLQEMQGRSINIPGNYCQFTSRLGSRVVSALDSGTEGSGFKSQRRCCRVTVLGKLLIPTVPLFTKQQKWQQPS